MGVITNFPSASVTSTGVSFKTSDIAGEELGNTHCQTIAPFLDTRFQFASNDVSTLKIGQTTISIAREVKEFAIVLAIPGTLTLASKYL